MSDGGGESSRETSKKRLKGDDFALSLAKIAVGQVCDAAGFQGVHQSALDTFSDVMVRYIHHAGKDAGLYANMSSRSESNALDIIQGLEDLGLPQGFSGARFTGNCLAGSGVVREISRYVSEEGENSFVYEVPSFPVVKDGQSALTFAHTGDLPPGHIPQWLPVFPETQTYSQEIQEDKTMKTVEPFRERMDVESLVVDNLHQHITCNGSEAPIPVEVGDALKAKQVVENKNNPFLASPLLFGEKEVTSIVIPPKLLDGSAMREIENYVPGFEVHIPVAKPMKSPLKETEEMKEKVTENVVPERRPIVQFKLKSLKRSLGTSPTVEIDGSEEICSLYEVNTDNHEAKRKAEQIMKETIDIVEVSAEL